MYIFPPTYQNIFLIFRKLSYKKHNMKPFGATGFFVVSSFKFLTKTERRTANLKTIPKAPIIQLRFSFTGLFHLRNYFSKLCGER